MDMHSREQYLEALREEYRRASKKQKSRLLSEARKRTRLSRKVLIRKLAHPAKLSQPKPKRGASYGSEVVTTLVEIWALLDFACGQRLVAALRTEVPRLRAAGQPAGGGFQCSEPHEPRCSGRDDWRRLRADCQRVRCPDHPGRAEASILSGQLWPT